MRSSSRQPRGAHRTPLSSRSSSSASSRRSSPSSPSASCRRARSRSGRRRRFENYVTIFESTSYISFLWSLGLGDADRHPPRHRLLPGRLRAEPRVRPLVDGADAPLRHPALRLGECPPLRLGAVPHQERHPARQHEDVLRLRAGEHPLHAAGDRARHGLRLPALHALPDVARRGDGAERGARGRLRSRRHAAGRCFARSSCRSPCPASSSASCSPSCSPSARSPKPRCSAGQKVIPITHDIEIAFTYAQNWPLGAALAVLLMLVVGVLVLLVLRRFDLDAVLGRRRRA